MKTRVLVIGAGISGLMAAHAATQFNCEVRIYSQKVPSKFYGAQYLHVPPMGTMGHIPAQAINYMLRGSLMGYGDKVYGEERPPLQLSPERYTGLATGYDIRWAYRWLQEAYWDNVINCAIRNDVEYAELLDYETGADVVVSTIPAKTICIRPEEHAFHSRKVWAIGDAPDLEVRCPVRVEPGQVICDGTRDIGWYRAANLFGHCTAEWPERARPPLPGVAAVFKPLSTTCDCWPGVVKGGRYGLWRKGELSHNVVERLYGTLFQVRPSS